ncbi:acyltransferase family protein [Streptococcus halotolerans]|uniref:acyltransferase family protein n=1 Tax=Streptococcus halotolerans TaxID=1814128 RepID=UPI0007872114|nr:acyltransferase family protein [Streptococcus halotolerans]
MRIQWFSFIRVLGLLFVLLYHFYKDILPGGFIGVDIFFTFSGYLITALLIDAVYEKKKIHLVDYLRRRFYRILPPLLFMILQVMPFALLIRRDFLASIGHQIKAALGFVTNIYEILLGSHYENQFSPHLFLHTWSLAIEFQYYLFWGIALWLLVKYLPKPESFRKGVLYLSAGLGLASALVMIVGSFMGVEDSVLYFSTFSHAFPLFVGSCFGALSGIKHVGILHDVIKNKVKPIQTLGLVLALTSLLLVLAKCLHFDSVFTYRFGFVLATGLTGFSIVLCRVLHDQFSGKTEPIVISFLANISYSVYLYHWPILQITKDLFSDHVAVLVTTLTSVVLSTISFYLLEPMLMGQIQSDRRQAILLRLAYGVALIYFMILGAYMVQIAKAAPVLGPFEQNMLEKNLQQFDIGMGTTKQLAVGGIKQPSSGQRAVSEQYDNVLVIGDSVALDSVHTMPEKLKSATVDVADSRRFDQAFDIYQNYIDSGNLPTYTVVAVGVNSPNNYQAHIQAFLAKLPKDHHLIFVTPYSQTEAVEEIKAIRDYELKLAEKDDRVSVADWYKIALEHTELWPGSDGTHFSHTVETSRLGAQLYLDAITAKLDDFKQRYDSAGTRMTDDLLFIGDSVAVHAGESVNARFQGAIIDSKSNRNLADAATIIKNYADNGALPKNIVVAVGVNEVTNSKEVLDDLVASLPDNRRLVLVTPYNGSYSNVKGSNVYDTRQNEMKLAKKYDFVAVADWKKTAEAHPEIWEGTDSVHFERTDGLLDYDLLAKASGYYTDTIMKALEKVQNQPAKGE